MTRRGILLWTHTGVTGHRPYPHDFDDDGRQELLSGYDFVTPCWAPGSASTLRRPAKDRAGIGVRGGCAGQIRYPAPRPVRVGPARGGEGPVKRGRCSSAAEPAGHGAPALIVSGLCAVAGGGTSEARHASSRDPSAVAYVFGT
jgi:hypothetical protein